MVAQIICVACSLAPEARFIEITFHKFPKAADNSALATAWKDALTASGKRHDGDLLDIYICSRHFVSDDFEFTDGKLILKSDAVPSIFTPLPIEEQQKLDEKNGTTEVKSPERNSSIFKDTPVTHGGNFAFTSTVNLLTTARNHILTLPTLTDTPKITTPSYTEYIPTIREIDAFEKINGKLSNDAKKALKDSRITIRH